MYHVVHLIHDKDKDLLNFVTKRIKVVYRINLPGTAFKKNKLPFKLLKPRFIYRPHTPELKSISKFQLLFHWTNFKNI